MFDLSKGQGYVLRSCIRPHSPLLRFIAVITALMVIAHCSATAHASPRPIAAYSFDEGSGTTTKDSAGNHDGTITGASWASVGKYGSALDFDGVNDLVSVADAADLDLTSSFTLEAWVRPDTATGSPTISKAEGSGGISGYSLNARYAGYPTGQVASSGTIKGVAAPTALPVETWSHIAFTADGTNLRFYVNGKLAANIATAATAKATAANLEIGHSQILGNWFNGLIDEVRVYDETLSESQIQVDRDTAVGLDQIPVAAYSFDEGSGSTAVDSVGNHDGTINGATWTTMGKYGSALDFDGEDDLVSIADAADLDLTSSFTLEAWVHPDTATNWTPVISKNESPESGYGPGYVLFSQGPGKPRGWLSNSETTKAVTGTGPLPTGKWSHLAFTSDGSILRLYVDGEEVSWSTAIDAGANSAPLEIGYWDFLDIYFDGMIDEVRVYDTALSQLQVQVDRDNRVEAPAPVNVTTRAIDTGESSELVSSVPISATGTETVVYSLPLPSLTEAEILRASNNLEVTSNHNYSIDNSIRLVLGSDPSDADGIVITPWTRVTQTTELHHLALPLTGAYRVPSTPGSTQYLKVVVNAVAPNAGPGDSLTIEPDSGKLSVLRSAPAEAPISQPIHELQAHIDPIPKVLGTIPVNSSWQRVMSRKVSGLSYDDILEIASLLEIQNTSGATVKLESKITYTSAPSSGGAAITTPAVDYLGPAMPSAHLLRASNTGISDPSKPYLNLVVRAVPISGTPSPLVVGGPTGLLNVIVHRPDAGDTEASLGAGTRVAQRIDYHSDVSSVPFAPATAPEPRVIASVSLPSGLWNDETIHARGLVTGDLDGGNGAQLITKLIFADTPTATTGNVIGSVNGDTIPTAVQVHTVTKDGMYTLPEALNGGKYVNLVVQASRVPEFTGESLSIIDGSIFVTRTRRTAPIDEGFETGLGSDGLNSVYEVEVNGELSASSTVAREGSKALLVDLDITEDAGELPGIRRVEARPPDIRSAAGYYGEDNWHGFSAYFPNGFKVPGPDPTIYFDGLLDEVRVYDQALSLSQIVDDREGNYAETPAPVAAYGFGEGSGLAAVDASGSYDGLIDGATWTSEGKYGAALDFDGKDDSVSIDDAAALDLAGGEFTLEAWVRPDRVSAWTGTPVISKIDDPNGTESGYLLRAAASGSKANGLVASSGSVANLNGAEALPLATWSHLALKSDGATMYLYIDGQLAGSRSAITTPATESALLIGASNYSTATAGTFNIFTQTHYVKEERPLLGCPDEFGGGVPHAFNVRHYKAGAHTNPGATETATPTEGDYIEVILNGGEVDANCEPVDPAEEWVIAPLERGRWYDFVLHTRWTQVEGTPGNSVSEVWLDGEQVLGDESTSIFRPTLAWRESLAMHNNSAYMQFGLYRGASLEDPATHHYIDAVRSGNSYGEVVPGQ